MGRPWTDPTVGRKESLDEETPKCFSLTLLRRPIFRIKSLLKRISMYRTLIFLLFLSHLYRNWGPIRITINLKPLFGNPIDHTHGWHTFVVVQMFLYEDFLQFFTVYESSVNSLPFCHTPIPQYYLTHKSRSPRLHLTLYLTTLGFIPLRRIVNRISLNKHIENCKQDGRLLALTSSIQRKWYRDITNIRHEINKRYLKTTDLPRIFENFLPFLSVTQLIKKHTQRR